MENTSIQEKKDFIQRTRQRGDVADACREAGYSETVFWSAMNREDDKYTVAEMELILAMEKKMQERVELRKAVGLTV